MTPSMKPLTEDLIAVLAAEGKLYDQVAGLLDQEREALMGRRPDVILDLVRCKETVLMQIRTLEESRLLILRRMAKLLGVASERLTVSEIGRWIEDGLRERLKETSAGLRACLERIQQANAANARLCRNGADLIARIVESAVQESARSRQSIHAGQPGAYGGGATPGRTAAGLQSGAVRVRM